MRRLGAAAVAIAAVIALAGCGETGHDDRSNHDVTTSDFDEVKVINNIDDYPNLECVRKNGIAFAMTSVNAADGGASHGAVVLRMPEWDKGCPAK